MIRLISFACMLSVTAGLLAAEEKDFAPSSVPTPQGCEQLAVKKPKGEHDLAKAMAQAKKDKKFLFIQYGRENCTLCQKVWNMLGDGRVALPKEFLYADVSCDDEETRAVFEEHFSIEDDGMYYPYIVIMGPDGSQMASCSGLKTPAQFMAMIQKARDDFALPQP